MQKLKKWIATPGRRLGTAFLLMLVGVPLGAVFAPLSVIACSGVIPMLMLGQQAKTEWSEGKQTDCPICGEKTAVQLVRIRNYMYPILPFVGRYVSIPIGSDYYLVCDKCLQTHVGERDLSAIMIIAKGGLAHAREISKQEYEELIR
jgi:hypothetical protein